MKKYLAAVLILIGCYANRPLMTYDEFASIPIGATKEEVLAEHGEPYAIHSRGGQCDEWEYIERFDVGDTRYAQRHYFLVFTNNKVVGKRVDTETPPPYIPTQTDDPFPYNS